MDGLTFTEPTTSRPELPLWKFIKYARDLWPLGNRKDDASRTQQQESNLRQSWGQAFVSLPLVAFAVYIQLFWSVQSRVQSIPESRLYRDPTGDEPRRGGLSQGNTHCTSIDACGGGGGLPYYVLWTGIISYYFRHYTVVIIYLLCGREQSLGYSPKSASTSWTTPVTFDCIVDSKQWRSIAILFKTQRISSSTVRPHPYPSVARPPAASHIKVTSPPCLFRLPPRHGKM